jgi:basic amino acid/polyamine antiporter, APA family
MQNPLSEEGLKRVVGVKSLAANTVNVTIASGIFALPAVIAFQLGAAALWAYLMCAILMVLVLLCFIEVGTKVTASGGAYAYIEKAFGPWAGFVANSIYWLGYTTMSAAAAANILADNLVLFLPLLSDPVYRAIFMAIVFGGIAGLNVLGADYSSRFIVGITVIKLVPLVVLIGVGIFHVQAENFQGVYDFTAAGVGQSALLLFFAFVGPEVVLSNTGEIKNPEYTIPRGLLVGVFIVFLIYVSIQFVSQGVLGDALKDQQGAPLAIVAEKIFGPYGSIMMLLAAALSCFAMISGDLFVSPRVPYAGARDGLLPSSLAKIHSKFATPYVSIMVYASVCFLFSISGGFRQLAVMSSAAILLIFCGVILATLRLRKVNVKGAYSNPGGITIPLLALVTTGWFFTHLAGREFAVILIFIVFFTALYFGTQRWKKRGGGNR